MTGSKQRVALVVAGALAVATLSVGVTLAATRSPHHRFGTYRIASRFLDRPAIPGPWTTGPFGSGPFGPGPIGSGPLGGRFGLRPELRLRAGLRPGLGLGYRIRARRQLAELSPAGLLHGQVTLDGPGGRVETLDFQHGNVTAVNAHAITVRSSDGFTATYAVTSTSIIDATKNGIASVHRGDSVRLRALVSGKTATVMRLTDLTRLAG